MFKCPDCDRVYKTRTSLTRHAHNHAATPSQHACDTCGVVFARRDILNRHKTNGHCSAANTGRHRVHTACDACRSARIKCDGQLPCRACTQSQRECKYPIRTGRVSQATRALQPHQNALDEQDMIDSPGLPGTDQISGTSDHTQAFGHEQGSPVHNTSSPGEPVVPWPWLHEKDFMGRGKHPGISASPRIRPVRNTNGISSEEQDADSVVSPNSSATDHHEPLKGLTNVIETLVGYAASTAFTPDDRSTRRRYWESISLQLADVFRASGDSSFRDERQLLYELVDIYLQRFNVLWPLLNHEQLDPDSHHPVLFLTVTSIGSMFGKTLQRQYGTLMHERLRRLLSASLYDLEGDNEILIWLAQARILTQVASLYFGQRKGMSYSQHLAAITIAQLRRMDFFREPIPDRVRPQFPSHEQAHWQHSETRRRLAFGILRTDIYTSVLLNTRPLLTAEEVRMTFPRSDDLWLNTAGLSSTDRILAQRKEDAAAGQMPFADIVRIFLDRDEKKPILSPVGNELALFGLQEVVWKFSQDPDLFPRLTGTFRAEPIMEASNTRVSSNPDKEQRTGGRKMQDMQSDYARLVHALDTWSQIVDREVKNGAYLKKRDTWMSSILLYQLSRLRLCAPLEDLHQISYRAATPKSVDSTTLIKVQTWCQSQIASEAAQKAWNIQKTIKDEMQRPSHEQARFNLLAFCSLHHSAVVLWAWQGFLCSPLGSTLHGSFDVSSEQIASFLDECPQLFKVLSPLGGNSFEAAAHRLQNNVFPTANLDVTMDE